MPGLAETTLGMMATAHEQDARDGTAARCENKEFGARRSARQGWEALCA
jgi:hypothetical protein